MSSLRQAERGYVLLEGRSEADDAVLVPGNRAQGVLQKTVGERLDTQDPLDVLEGRSPGIDEDFVDIGLRRFRPFPVERLGESPVAGEGGVGQIPEIQRYSSGPTTSANSKFK